MPNTTPIQGPPDQTAYLKEFISGGYQAALAAVRQCLPQYIDDVTRDFGSEVYERMLTDPAVSAAFDQWKLGILSDGIRIEPAVAMPGEWEEADAGKKADAEQAKEYADFLTRCVDGLDGQPLLDVADELLDGGAYGHKVAEILLKDGIGEDLGKWVLRSIKPKKRKTVGFVVDEYGNTVGLVGADPCQNSLLSGYSLLIGEIQNFVPREKVVVFQHRVKNADPRGTSILRPAYNAWFLKTQVLPEFFKFLKQFASPGIIGKTPEAGAGFVPQVNPDGTPVMDASGVPQLISAEQALMSALLQWMNATVLVVKGGTEIDFLQSDGDGEAFLKATDYFDRQIFLAILGTAGLNLEAKNDSQSSKGAGQDVVAMRSAYQKGRLAGVLTRDLARVLIRLNYGDGALRLCPNFVLSKVEAQDFAKDLAAVSAAYGSGFIHESQLPGLDSRLGLPKRDMQQIARDKAESKQMERLRLGDVNNVLRPGADPGDENPTDQKS